MHINKNIFEQEEYSYLVNSCLYNNLVLDDDNTTIEIKCCSKFTKDLKELIDNLLFWGVNIDNYPEEFYNLLFESRKKSISIIENSEKTEYFDVLLDILKIKKPKKYFLFYSMKYSEKYENLQLICLKLCFKNNYDISSRILSDYISLKMIEILVENGFIFDRDYLFSCRKFECFKKVYDLIDFIDEELYNIYFNKGYSFAFQYIMKTYGMRL
uniref:Uncharacterized protein n=1 Tax=viral metagenome TaxID=1070528 RepID=A0A6C0AFX9_9ZZZZ